MAVRCMKNKIGIDAYRLPTELKTCDTEGTLVLEPSVNPSVRLAMAALNMPDPYSNRPRVILYKAERRI
jgi:hypothetical protein